jgi:hypothetical protein
MYIYIHVYIYIYTYIQAPREDLNPPTVNTFLFAGNHIQIRDQENKYS